MTDSPLHKLAALACADPDPEVVALGERLAAWADGKVAGSLDAALGFPARFAADNARARRAKLLRDLAAHHFATETKRGRARSILSALSTFHDQAVPGRRSEPA